MKSDALNCLEKLQNIIASSEGEVERLTRVIQNSRSPGLSNSIEELLTERLMAHPVRSSIRGVTLKSVPAYPLSNRVAIAERLIVSYHKALADEQSSSLKRSGEDLWTGLLRSELPDLMASIDRRDPVALSEFLFNFGKDYVWFGGITTCVDGYNRNRDRNQIALTYFDKLVCFAESLGLLRLENPENGPWGENLFVNPKTIVDLISKELGIQISAPMGIIHTDGVLAGEDVFHYRHINALYSASRVARLCESGSAICEFGGGLGLTALYAQRLGLGRYTILDLPITCLLAGHYLLHAVGEDRVRLYGESGYSNSQIELLPYWECLKLPGKNFEMVLNQDSFPEIADNLVVEFLSQIQRIGSRYFLSINHECFYPKTVRNFVQSVGGYKEVYRSRCWVREGYLEELYRISGVGG